VARALTAKREFVFDYALLGDALMEQGKLGGAVEAYQKMVDLRPSLQTNSRVAHMRWLKGDLRGAIEASRLAVSSGSPREAEPTAWAYTRLAAHELQAGDFEQARVAAERAVDLMPDYAPALLTRGRLLLSQSKYEEAVEPLRRAAELSPLPDYLWALADALRGASKNAEAEKVERQLTSTGAVSDPRTFAIFLATRGESADKALELATTELQSRKDVFTYDALAWAQLATGQVNEAREHIRLALAEGTQDARLYLHAGAIAAAAGDNAEALDFFAKARALEQTLLPSERVALGERSAALFQASSQISVN
jgi:tetratricopeptide (TPR) repeat protein